MEKEKDTAGPYDKLAPQVVRSAYAEAERWDLEQRLAQKNAEIAELKQQNQAQLDASLKNLVESGLGGDELLQEYDEIVRNLGDVKLTERFEEMLRLGARLVPGEVFLMGDEVKEIAEPGEEGTDAEQPAEPLLIGKDTFNHGTQYSLAWSVSVSRLTIRVKIDDETPVGRESIKSKLDKVHIDYDDGGRDAAVYAMIKLARAYTAIGDTEAVKRRLDGYLGHFSYLNRTQFPAF